MKKNRSRPYGSDSKAAAAVALIAASAAGCSSVEVIASSPAIPEGQCSVAVYQTRGQALKAGAIDELCVISGTSSGSFSHTVATAIQKHKGKACGCGATRVFIESRAQSGWDVATVTLIAFRYQDSALEAVPASQPR